MDHFTTNPYVTGNFPEAEKVLDKEQYEQEAVRSLEDFDVELMYDSEIPYPESSGYPDR